MFFQRCVNNDAEISNLIFKRISTKQTCNQTTGGWGHNYEEWMKISERLGPLLLKDAREYLIESCDAFIAPSRCTSSMHGNARADARTNASHSQANAHACTQDSTDGFAHLEKCSLFFFSSSTFAIRFNLLHPWPSLSLLGLLLNL